MASSTTATPLHPLQQERTPYSTAEQPVASTSSSTLDSRGGGRGSRSQDERGGDKPFRMLGNGTARGEVRRSGKSEGKQRDLEEGDSSSDESEGSSGDEDEGEAGVGGDSALAAASSTAPAPTPTRPPLAQLPSVTSTTTGFTIASLPPTSPSLLLPPSSPSSPSSTKTGPILFAIPSITTQTHSQSHPSTTNTTGGGGTGLGSWKSRSGGPNIEKKRLAALGFEEELSRDYDFWAVWGLTLCNIGGFPGNILAVLTAFNTGSGSMYAIAWPISGLFMLCLAAVLGEMASTWPVAGAMFTWTFRLCRSSRRLDPWARFLSWIVGSFLLCSHVLLQVVISWQFAHNLLGTIGLYTHLRYSNWVTLAICWAILVLSGLVVSSPISRSPWLWRLAGAAIVVFFLTLNITLLSQASEIRSAKFVFTDYRNNTGFESKSYVYMLGWVLTCVASGMEAAAHIAEDTKSPARTVPLAMFWSVAATYAMGWVSICVLLATMDVSNLDPTLQPSIAVIANSIPRRHTTLLLTFVLLSFLLQSIAQLIATSRFTWALARESALPCSDFLRRLSTRDKLPLRTIWVVVGVAAPVLILLTINTSIISTIILEGAGVSVMASYGAPAALYLLGSRDALVGDGRGKWTLRGWTKPAAVLATLFTCVFMIMLCLPTGWPVTPLNASYAAAILVGIPILGSIAWVFYGNARYAGPIKTTTRWTIGAEVDLPRTGSASRSKATNKKATATPAPPAPAPTTSSAAHGRSAHVFSSFPTLMTHDGPPHSGDEGEGESGASEWTEASRSSWDEGTGTGTGWTGASLSAGGTTTSGATATPGQSRVGRAREGGEEEQGARGRERSAQR